MLLSCDSSHKPETSIPYEIHILFKFPINAHVLTVRVTQNEIYFIKWIIGDLLLSYVILLFEIQRDFKSFI